MPFRPLAFCYYLLLNKSSISCVAPPWVGWVCVWQGRRKTVFSFFLPFVNSMFQVGRGIQVFVSFWWQCINRSPSLSSERAPLCFTVTFGKLKSGLSPFMGKRKGNCIFQVCLNASIKRKTNLSLFLKNMKASLS